MRRMSALKCLHDANIYDEGNEFGEKVVDFEKHCSLISSPKYVLRVSYAEVLKQPTRRPQSLVGRSM